MSTKAKREKTPKQNRTLNWLLTEAGLFDDDARDFLETACGKRYRRDMDFYDYQKAINALADLTGAMPASPTPPTMPAAAGPAPAQREPGSKDDPATAEQLTYIREMLEKMGADYKRRGRWIARQIGNAFPRTIGEAQGLIEALKNMQARDYRFDGPKEGEKAK